MSRGVDFQCGPMVPGGLCFASVAVPSKNWTIPSSLFLHGLFKSYRCILPSQHRIGKKGPDKRL